MEPLLTGMIRVVPHTSRFSARRRRRHRDVFGETVPHEQPRGVSAARSAPQPRLPQADVALDWSERFDSGFQAELPLVLE